MLVKTMTSSISAIAHLFQPSSMRRDGLEFSPGYYSGLVPTHMFAYTVDNCMSPKDPRSGDGTVGFRKGAPRSQDNAGKIVL
jgi:hypothetical protein